MLILMINLEFLYPLITCEWKIVVKKLNIVVKDGESAWKEEHGLKKGKRKIFKKQDREWRGSVMEPVKNKSKKEKGKEKKIKGGHWRVLG